MRTVLVYHNPSREIVPAPPVGLAYVASAAADAGHSVRFLDLSHSRRPARVLADAVARERPGVVGFSIRNLDNVVRQRLESHLRLHDELIDVAHAAGARVVVGGPAVSLLGERALGVLRADFAVVGEGEETFPALLAALDDGRDPAGLPGLVWRDGGGAPRSAPERRLARLGPSGLERWIEWDDYRHRGFTWPIQTKRGCPFGCIYCCYPALEGRQHRSRPPGEVADEIERVARIARPRTFEFVDSTFNVPAEPAVALCHELRRRGLKHRYTTMGINPAGASAELFAEMEATGFNSLMVTPESASERMLHNLAKGFGRDQVERTADLLRRSRMASAWFFLLGGPGETEETVEETLEFVERRLDAKRFLVIVFTGIRIHGDTPLARSEEAAGRLAPGADLTEPLFYLSSEVSEEWMLTRVNRTIDRRPNVVHAAEGSPSAWQKFMWRVLDAGGAAPPFWRFVPSYISLPPIRALRRRFPSVGGVAT